MLTLLSSGKRTSPCPPSSSSLVSLKHLRQSSSFHFSSCFVEALIRLSSYVLHSLLPRADSSSSYHQGLLSSFVVKAWCVHSSSSVSCSLFPTGSPSVLRNLLAPYGLPPQFLSALHDLVYGETPPQSYHIPYSVVPPYGLPSSPLQGICVFFVVGNSFLP